MADVYVKSGSGALPFNNDVVATARAYTLGERMVPRRADATANNAVAKAWVWEVTTAGTSGTTDPTWPATVTQDTTTVTSGTVVFTARRPGFSSGTTVNWSFATIYLDYANLATTNGDVIYVSNLHSQTNAGGAPVSSNTINANPLSPKTVICVQDTVAPPVISSSGAVHETGAGVDLNLAGNLRIVGMTFRAQPNNNGNLAATNIVAGSTDARKYEFDRCIFHNASSAQVTAQIASGTSFQAIEVNFDSCEFIQNNASTNWLIRSAIIRFENCKWSGTPATVLARHNADGRGVQLLYEGCDFSGCASSLTLYSPGIGLTKAIYRNCKLPSNWTGDIVFGSPPQGRFELHNCDSGPTNYKLRVKTAAGNIDSNTSIARVSGAFDGTISYSWLMQTNTVATYVNNLDSPEIVRYNSVTATPITVSLDILSPSSSLTDSDVWLEVQYLSSNSSPISSFISDNTASVNGGNVLAIPVAQQSSTSTWINEPANSFKHTLSVTFTPQMKGYIHAVVRLAKPSTTIYVDPKLTVV